LFRDHERELRYSRRMSIPIPPVWEECPTLLGDNLKCEREEGWEKKVEKYT
jgi:hypothetical protein